MNSVTNEDKDKGPEHKLVAIRIDNRTFEVRPGDYTVSELKHIGGVNPAYDLLEKEHGKLVPLADDASVHIEGGEVFFSQPKSGASS